MQNEKKVFDKLIMALFNDYGKAGKAYNAALKLGYKKEEISIVMSEEAKKKHHFDRRHKNVLPSEEAIKGAGVGGALGVTTGAIMGAIIAGGTALAMPGINLIISGSIALLLAGAGAGGIAGGLVGALINLGISEDHAENCLAEIKSGGILISVAPSSVNDYKLLETTWKSYGGVVLTSR